jgi:uncharacterized coiled-coil DUF342 family protein
MERKIALLEQQMNSVCNKIDKLDKKIDKGFKDITHNYVRKDNYRRDIKAIEKEDLNHTKDIESIRKSVNKLIWLIASTIFVFIIMQILGI